MHLPAYATNIPSCGPALLHSFRLKAIRAGTRFWHFCSTTTRTAALPRLLHARDTCLPSSTPLTVAALTAYSTFLLALCPDAPPYHLDVATTVGRCIGCRQYLGDSCSTAQFLLPASQVPLHASCHPAIVTNTLLHATCLHHAVAGAVLRTRLPRTGMHTCCRAAALGALAAHSSNLRSLSPHPYPTSSYHMLYMGRVRVWTCLSIVAGHS